MNAIVVTGAGGFVGRKLVSLLCEKGLTVIGIGRSAAPSDWPSGARWIQADLAEPQRYEAALKGAQCVAHLAAITGKARRQAYVRGNVEATRALIDATVRASVPRFVFVSSIAAKFADRRHYHYAESKRAAEALVRQAPLASVLVRPTMILGPGSPIEASLAKLARMPVSPIFGDGRRLVQPVDVDDVAEAVAAIVSGSDFRSDLIELGGPERYDLCELYRRLRTAHAGLGAPRFVSAPLSLSRMLLAALEGPLLPVLPLTAGQLATFANDGLADPHPEYARILPNPRPAPRTVSATSPAGDGLDAEFRRYANYLAGLEPTAYQLGKYRDFHSRRTLAPTTAFDAFLLRISRSGRLGLALSDSYSGLLARKSTLRAKLVLAIAILESSSPSFETLDAPEPGGAAHAFTRMALHGAAAGLSFLVATLFFGPAHAFLRTKPAR